jgi:preprotein translocase subunit YajC
MYLQRQRLMITIFFFIFFIIHTLFVIKGRQKNEQSFFKAFLQEIKKEDK